MLDEVVFMQARIFRMFCDKVHCSAAKGNTLFEQYGIWTFLEECYDDLHLSSDDNALDYVIKILESKGVCL